MKSEITPALKKYGVMVALVSTLGLGTYFEGIRPVFAYQLAQTNKKLDNFACLQIVIEYQQAKARSDATMVAYWLQQAGVFGCTLPS